jgi:hypothetical protein
MKNEQITKSWWREPWPWILMAGPALAIVACVITMYLAFTRFADQAVQDGGTKRGLVVDVPAAPAVKKGN